MGTIGLGSGNDAEGTATIDVGWSVRDRDGDPDYFETRVANKKARLTWDESTGRWELWVAGFSTVTLFKDDDGTKFQRALDAATATLIDLLLLD